MILLRLAEILIIGTVLAWLALFLMGLPFAVR